MTADHYHYELYGLAVISSIELPELTPLPGPFEESADTIRIERGRIAQGGLANGSAIGAFCQTSRDELLLEIPNIARILVSEGRRILIEPSDGIDEASVRVFLLGSGIGALLMQRDYFLLHGNAIELGDGCIICVGPSGAGKSTLAAAMMKRGHRIVADDVCPIDDNGFVLPGMPRLKLWHDTAGRLAIDTDGLDRIRPAIAKYNFPLGDAFSSEPLPVKAIYVLQPWNQDRFDITTVTGIEKFEALRANSYRFGYLAGMDRKPRHLEQASRIAARVPVAVVNRPRAGFLVDQLAEIIIADGERCGAAR